MKKKRTRVYRGTGSIVASFYITLLLVVLVVVDDEFSLSYSLLVCLAVNGLSTLDLGISLLGFIGRVETENWHLDCYY